MFDEFQDPIQNILDEEGIEKEIRLFKPPSPDLGDFCFVVNQISGDQDPEELGKKILPKLQRIDGIQNVKLFNAGNDEKKIIYLNFVILKDDREKIQTKRLKNILIKVYSQNFGYLDDNKGKKVIVEHTSVNPISPIHVGNLRNSVQGDTFARILKRSGYNVFRHFYVNDVGLQIGIVVVGYELATKDLKLKPPIKIDLWTGQIYAIMNCLYNIQKIKENAKERGVKVNQNYKFSKKEANDVLKAVQQEIDSVTAKLKDLEINDEQSRMDDNKIKSLKMRKNKLEDEFSDIEKYITTFDELKSRFQTLFDQLYNAVEKIDLKKRVENYLKLYEANEDKRITELFREVVSWVLEAIEWTLERYNIQFDQFDYESDVTWSGLPSEIIDKLATSDNATVEGSAVRFSYPPKAMNDFVKAAGISENDLPIKGQVPDLQLRRSDGTALYAAKDIAYSIRKYEQRDPERIYNVISSEQKLPQFQMLLPLHELGMTSKAKNLIHYSYELVELLGRTMSGRLAKYITADDYYDETFIRARMARRKSAQERNKSIPQSEEEWQEEEQILRSVTLASTRFPLIETAPSKKIELDLDRELDFKRNAGPFVQYAHARCNSLLMKVKQKKNWEPSLDIEYSHLADHEIVEIFDHLNNLDDQIRNAIQQEDPSKIANWVFQLSQIFMKFYENYPILKAASEEVAKARLSAVFAIKKGISTGLEILGITPAPKL